MLIAVAPQPGAFDIGQLMGDLARHKGGKAKFVEKKYFAILDKPVVSTGEMTYTAAGPPGETDAHAQVETLLLDKDILPSNATSKAVHQPGQPAGALAFVDSIRGTLSGNRAALEKNYACIWPAMPIKWDAHPCPATEDRQPGAAHHGQRQQEPGARHRIPAGRRRPLGVLASTRSTPNDAPGRNAVPLTIWLALAMLARHRRLEQPFHADMSFFLPAADGRATGAGGPVAKEGRGPAC